MDEQYEANGYVLPASLPRALPADKARQLGEQVLAMQEAEGQAAGALLHHGHTRWRWIYDIVASPAILDSIERCIGPDILVWSVSLFAKPPRSTGYVGWHQDINYWGLEPADGVITAWVALTDVGADSGPMEWLRGSHKEVLRAQVETYAPDNMLSRGQEIEWTGPIDPERVASATMGAGCFSLHHACVAHRSTPNTSDRWRIGLAIRYMPCSTRSTSAEETAMLVRGVDHFKNFTLERPPGTDSGDAATVAQFEHGRRVKHENTMRDAKRKDAPFQRSKY